MGVTALTALLSADVTGARLAVEAAARSGASGGSTSSFYVKLVMEHALNASGLPGSVATATEVVEGVVSGNATRVLVGIAAEYQMPSSMVEAVVALSGLARPSPREVAGGPRSRPEDERTVRARVVERHHIFSCDSLPHPLSSNLPCPPPVP